MDKKIEKYYENTKSAPPYKNVERFIELEKRTGKAIDLGCGTGRDTTYLIKNGWSVLAIDQNDTSKIIKEKLTEEELSKFRFLKQNFENIKLEKCDLIVANYSIPFCDKEHFKELWNKIVDSINEDGYFVGNLFGNNDDWKKRNLDYVFLSENEVRDLFKNFEIIALKEIEKDGKTGLNTIKHWHLYTIIAKKNNRN